MRSDHFRDNLGPMKNALQDQYHAALAMLADCIEKCPDHLWNSAKDYRSFWRIALHAIYYTHLYLGQGVDTFTPWPGDARKISPDLLEDPDDPFPLLPDAEVYTKQELMDYLRSKSSSTPRYKPWISRLISPASPGIQTPRS